MIAHASPRAYLVAVAVGLAIVLGYWWMAHVAMYPVLPDTASYLEMARSFLAHRRFDAVPYGLVNSESATTATALWPPLYPLTIALLAKLGVADVVAAPLINRGCFALLPAAMLWAFGGLTSQRRLFIAGLLAMSAPGVLATQYFGLSEGLCTLFLVLAMGCALRSDRPLMLVLSGLFSGASYVTRNPALAICAAIPIWLALLDEVESTAGDARIVRAKRLASWGAGVVLAVLPLAIYNLRVFGQLQPYTAARSTTGWLPNVWMLTTSAMSELVGARGADPWFSSPFMATVAAILLLSLTTWIWQARPAEDVQGRGVRLLLVVAALMSLLLVIAASRYQFQGLNDHRFVAPYLWTLLVAGAIVFPERSAPTRQMAVAAIVCLLAARGYDSVQRVRHRIVTVEGPVAVSRDDALRRYLADVGEPRTFVASNAAWILNAEVGSYARQLRYCPDFDGQMDKLSAVAAAGRPVAVVITARVSMDSCELEWSRALQGAGFTAAFRSPQSVVYRKEAAPPTSKL